MEFAPNPAPALESQEWPEELQTLEAGVARVPQEPAEIAPASGPHLNWLFVDMNSYFA